MHLSGQTAYLLGCFTATNFSNRIYKDKYMLAESKSEDARTPRSFMQRKGSEKKPRDKSRTRTMFGGKRKAVVAV